MAVGLLTGEELVDNLLNISKPSACPDLLEGIFYFVGPLHLTVHLPLHELRPHLLNHKALQHLQLIRVLVLICGCFSNLLLSCNSIHSTLKGFFFVLD